MSNEQKKEFPLTPEGRYEAKVIGHDIGESSNGTPQIAIRFGFKDSDGKELTEVYYGYFSEKSMAAEKGIFNTLRNLGWDADARGYKYEQLASKDKDNPEGGALIGASASIVVEHEVQEQGENKGKKRSRVAWVNAPGGGALMKNVATGAAAKTLSQKIRGIATGQGGGGMPAISTGSGGGSQGAQLSRGAAPAAPAALPF
jgi:hypothetical protein